MNEEMMVNGYVLVWEMMVNGYYVGTFLICEYGNSM